MFSLIHDPLPCRTEPLRASSQVARDGDRQFCHCCFSHALHNETNHYYSIISPYLYIAKSNRQKGGGGCITSSEYGIWQCATSQVVTKCKVKTNIRESVGFLCRDGHRHPKSLFKHPSLPLCVLSWSVTLIQLPKKPCKRQKCAVAAVPFLFGM